MKLAGQTVTLLLTEDGKQILKLAASGIPESNSITVSVEESEDLGLWIRLRRPDQMHFFLLRWDYILAVDLPSGMGKLIGLKR